MRERVQVHRENTEKITQKLLIGSHSFRIDLEKAKLENTDLNVYDLSFEEENSLHATINLTNDERNELFNGIHSFVNSASAKTSMDVVRFSGSTYALSQSESIKLKELKNLLLKDLKTNELLFNGFDVSIDGVHTKIQDGNLYLSDSVGEAEYPIKELLSFPQEKRESILPEWFYKEILLFRYNTPEETRIIKKNFDEDIKNKKSQQRMIMFQRFLSKIPNYDHIISRYGAVIIILNKDRKESIINELS